jgi:S-adenosylmethionine:tRNA ribosyltransferase-isomerase
MEEYAYDLPQHRIAEYPAEERDASKLLVNGPQGPSEDVFSNLPKHLPDDGILVFNNTRVIRARLVFYKESGARIEVFCLEPVAPTYEIAGAFEARSPVVWKCLIGNAKKWRSGSLKMKLQTDEGPAILEVERKGDSEGDFLVEFKWTPARLSLAEVLEAAGKVPLPPYIDREVEQDDSERYQTIYAEHNGSVAAPTAGLHFTENVLDQIKNKNIEIANVVLHVSAGTFKPVSHDDIRDHEMHTEQVIISKKLVESLLNNKGKLTAVGTTSMRSLESLYWYGNELESNPDADFDVKQWQPYENRPQVSVDRALRNILSRMERRGGSETRGQTSLIIVPSYKFKLVDVLVTNFHMPKSTLLLLVAAFSGERWKEAYQFALENNFRFLSYGDSCLFFRNDQNL